MNLRKIIDTIHGSSMFIAQVAEIAGGCPVLSDVSEGPQPARAMPDRRRADIIKTASLIHIYLTPFSKSKAIVISMMQYTNAFAKCLKYFL